MMSELGEFKEKTEDYGYGILTWNKYETWLSTQYGIEIWGDSMFKRSGLQKVYGFVKFVFDKRIMSNLVEKDIYKIIGWLKWI